MGDKMRHVKEIRFVLVLDNGAGGVVTREAIMIREAKVKEMMEEAGTLGDLLRAMAAPLPVDDADIESVSPAEPKKEDN